MQYAMVMCKFAMSACSRAGIMKCNGVTLNLLPEFLSSLLRGVVEESRAPPCLAKKQSLWMK